ncbi:MAG TPA: DciA family protein [Actinospica sp.]|jgi:predicted nucleic acid-binding Zn ribbon protein|nr:DciA family protein [Actinospica sp.]
MSGESDPKGIDLARAALAAARKRAKELEDEKARRSAAGRRAGAQRRSGSRSDDRDPQSLQATIGRLMSEHGWETPVAVGGVVHNWPQVVGERIAEHCVPVGFADGVLTVQADSPAWAVELRHLSTALLAKLNESVPSGPDGRAVKRIAVLGPAKPRLGLNGFR